MLLANRIAALENQTAQRLDDAPGDFDPCSIYRFVSKMAFMPYNTWRHAALSLEERLALARDDIAHAESEATRTPSPGRRQNGRGLWVSIWPEVSTREIAIRIGERDSMIDQEAADALRENLHAHFFADTEALQTLPYSIELDQAVIKNVRATCPRRDALSLQRQLTMLNEDHDHEIALRAERHDHGARPSATFDSLDAFQDRMHEILAKELLARIREADRSP